MQEDSMQLLRRIYKIGQFSRTGNTTTIKWSRQKADMRGEFEPKLVEKVEWVDVYPFGEDSDDEVMGEQPPENEGNVEEAEEELDDEPGIEFVGEYVDLTQDVEEF
jgi:hypothetical protein